MKSLPATPAYFLSGAALVSLLLSAIVYFFQQPPINIDGILYLQVAKVYSQSGLHAAMALYPWPFYSIVVGYLSEITHLSLLNTAYLINSIFIAITIIAYLLLLRALSASRAVLYCGAILILLFPELNQCRSFVMRDPGYWAFMLLAVFQLLKYVEYPRFWKALSFQLLLLLSALFRIEGMFLLLFAPLLLLLSPEFSWRKRIWQVVQNYSVLLLLGIFFFIHHAAPMGRLAEVMGEFHNGLQLTVDKFSSGITTIQQTTLNGTVGASASVFLWGGLIALFINGVIGTLGLLNLFLIGYAFYKKLLSQRLLIALVILSLLMPVIFLSQQFFVDSRYLLPGSFLLLLWAPFALNNLRMHGPKKLFYIVVLALLVMAYAAVIPFGYSKTYLGEAGAWMQQHVSSTTKVYSNSPEVLFYSGRWDQAVMVRDNPVVLPLKNQDLQPYDYLALRINHDDGNTWQQVVKQLSLKPVATFTNKRNDKVMIFYVSH